MPLALTGCTLRTNPRDMKHKSGVVVGIDMGASHLHFALADLGGKVLGGATGRLRPEGGPRKIIAQIKEGIREVTGRAEQRAAPLRSIAIGVPSPVDDRRDTVALAANLPGWRKVRLGDALEREFRAPVWVENDANMAAIGEHWRGVARGMRNFVFIAIGTGIGAGIFVDGKLYRGRSGAAGEVSSMNVDWQRWAEDFGAVGYLETHAGGLGIAAEGQKLLGSMDRARASSLAEERDAFFVFEAYQNGNAEAVGVLEKAFTMLGVAMANIVSVLDPELIVMGGGISKGAPKLMLATLNKVARRIHKNPPPIKLSALGDQAQTCGAIFLALTLAQDLKGPAINGS